MLLLALTTGALALCGTAAATAGTSASAPKPTASPCPLPDSGFQSCLRVLYKADDDADEDEGVDAVRMTATLLRRVARCPAHPASRRVTITGDDGTRLDRVRRPGSCRRGIVSWRAAFSTGETAGWNLREGDTVHAMWRGVRNAASVKIRGDAAGD
jgi:hypothetical protein